LNKAGQHVTNDCPHPGRSGGWAGSDEEASRSAVQNTPLQTCCLTGTPVGRCDDGEDQEEKPH